MPSRVVSVDDNLAEVREHLSGRGYEVVASHECCRSVEAVVYSGPLLPDQKEICCAKGTALVNAAGLTAEGVEMHLDRKLGD